MTTGTQKWFVATTAELTDYLQQRIALYDTAKPTEPCLTCATEWRQLETGLHGVQRLAG